ncbi:MAG: hypothetical protein U0R64_07005 [Candidatus Nanopelagicales bacterium]
MSRFPTTPSGPRPWWESEIPEYATAPVAPRDDVVDLTGTTATLDEPRVTPTPTPSVPLSRRITLRGLLLLLAGPTFVLCLIGFVVSGATSIPPLAGIGLMLGSVAVGLVAPPTLGRLPIAFPPLVMLAVILVAGQVTLIGSRPTLGREFAMVVSQLTATAPAQVGSVAIIAVLLFLRRRLSSGSRRA